MLSGFKMYNRAVRDFIYHKVFHFKSDVVVQILDARNPLLFRCEDLESYVTEVNASKVNVLLINKADFLTQEQRYCSNILSV